MRTVATVYRGKSVRVFRLDRERVLSRLRERSAALVASHSEVLEVRLFGSLARGEALPGSDADLLLVLREASLSFLDRMAFYAPAFAGVGIGCELRPLTEAELARMRERGSRFARTVEREGLVLARR